MASKAVAFLALCCLLLAAKQVAAGRGRILNDNLADAEINKTTRKLIEDQALYNDLLNNPTKYATPQNGTPPKFDIVLKEDVLHREILKNPAKFNAILNDTALNNDPAKVIELNETAMFDEILHNPIKYTEITNGPAQNNNTAKYNNHKYSTVLNGTAPNNLTDTSKYNTLMGYWSDLYDDWMKSVDLVTYNNVLNGSAHNNSTANYNTLMGFRGETYNNWMNSVESNKDETNDYVNTNTIFNDAAHNSSTAKYNKILSAETAQP